MGRDSLAGVDEFGGPAGSFFLASLLSFCARRPALRPKLAYIHALASRPLRSPPVLHPAAGGGTSPEKILQAVTAGVGCSSELLAPGQATPSFICYLSTCTSQEKNEQDKRRADQLNARKHRRRRLGGAVRPPMAPQVPRRLRRRLPAGLACLPNSSDGSASSTRIPIINCKCWCSVRVHSWRRFSGPSLRPIVEHSNTIQPRHNGNPRG